MQIIILASDDIVGVYDEETQELESNDGRLQRMVTDGVTALGSGDVTADYQGDAEVTVRPGGPMWFFAFIDELWRKGYDVDQGTYDELQARAKK